MCEWWWPWSKNPLLAVEPELRTLRTVRGLISIFLRPMVVVDVYEVDCG